MNWTLVNKILAIFRPETEDPHPVRTSVHIRRGLSPNSPMTGGSVTEGPNFQWLAAPSIEGGEGYATPPLDTVEVVDVARSEAKAPLGYIALCRDSHAEAPGVVGDGTWYGERRSNYEDAVNDAANHAEHPGAAVVHALLANGVSIGPLIG